MRLRGGGPDASVHGQEGIGGGTLTEGGLPRHASAHGQEGDAGGTLTEGGLGHESGEESGDEGSHHASAHGQDGGGGGALTEGGLLCHSPDNEPEGKALASAVCAATQLPTAETGALATAVSATTQPPADRLLQAVRDALKLQGDEVDEREVQAYVLEALGVELSEEELIPIIEELIDEENAAAAAAAATRAARRAEIFAGSMLVDKEQGGLPRHVSAHGQEGDGGGGLTEGGLPRHESAHGQEGDGGGGLTEGGLPRHESAHGQDGGNSGVLTEGGLTIELATSEPADRQRQALSDADRREQWRAARDEHERAAHAERQRQQPPEMLIDFESLRKLERKAESMGYSAAAYWDERVEEAKEICPEWLAELRREFDGETRLTAEDSAFGSEAPSLRNYRNKAKRTRDSLPARFYRMIEGEEWDGEAHSYSKARKKYRRWEEPYQQRERERQQRKKRDYSKKKRPADDNARRQARRIAQRGREKATLAASASAHGQECGGGGSLTEGGQQLLPSAPRPPSAPPRSPPPSPPTLSPQPSPPPSSRSVVICEGERERVIGCETVGDVLSQLASMGVDGDYLTNGRMGERLDDAERLSDIDGELWMRVRGRGGARGLDVNDGGGGEDGCESGQGDEPMDVTDGVRVALFFANGVRDHAREEARAFLALHGQSNRGPKRTSDNREAELKAAARLRTKLAKEAQQSSTEASCSEQPKKAEPKNPALPRMPRKPEHVKDPAEDAARMAEYAAKREEAMRAKAAHAEQEKQRHREEKRARERARRADLADEQRQAEQEAQAAAQRERRDAMPKDKYWEERFAQQHAQEKRRAAIDDEQRQVEREAQAAAQRERRGVTPLYNALQLPVGQREDQLLYDLHASGSGFGTVNSRRLRTLTPGSPLHTQCVNTVLPEIRLRGHVTVADRARMVFAFKDSQTFGPKGSVPDQRRQYEALRKDRPIISDEETRLLALAGIHPWQYRCVDNWNYCETDDFLLAAERYQRWKDTPEGSQKLRADAEMNLAAEVINFCVRSPETKYQKLLATMNMAATIISARVRGYLTRRAYLGAADHESEAEHARLDARLDALLDRLAALAQGLPDGACDGGRASVE